MRRRSVRQGNELTPTPTRFRLPFLRLYRALTPSTRHRGNLRVLWSGTRHDGALAVCRSCRAPCRTRGTCPWRACEGPSSATSMTAGTPPPRTPRRLAAGTSCMRSWRRTTSSGRAPSRSRTGTSQSDSLRSWVGGIATTSGRCHRGEAVRAALWRAGHLLLRVGLRDDPRRGLAVDGQAYVDPGTHSQFERQDAGGGFDARKPQIRHPDRRQGRVRWRQRVRLRGAEALTRGVSLLHMVVYSLSVFG